MACTSTAFGLNTIALALHRSVTQFKLKPAYELLSRFWHGVPWYYSGGWWSVYLCILIPRGRTFMGSSPPLGIKGGGLHLTTLMW